jgi:UDP-N-acetylmuramoyl-tripeptide--D-alanyl-D-alanine ligase
MDPRPLNYIAEATGGRLQGEGGALVTRVCTDSRKVAPGDLFVALKGENFDAHDFIPDVVGKAPAAVMVREDYSHPCLQNCSTVLVGNTREALGKLASRYRRDFNLPVIAVAGSNGKTTTKELVAAVLRQKFPTASSPASFNNDVGVPLSLLQIGSEHKAAVLEVGTNHPGELEPLLRLIAPGYSIITSIGREHMEHFGTVEQVAQEEGWAAELLPDHGKLFLNGDTPWASAITRRTGATTVTVGRDPENDWRVTAARISKSGTAFDLETSAAGFAGAYQVPLFGLHQAVNAAFAVALGAELGLSREQVLHGLADCPPPALRLQVWEAGGVSVLDDSYNANTDSMIAALQTLRELPLPGQACGCPGGHGRAGFA